MRKSIYIGAVITFCLWVAAANAEIYTYTDKNGVIHLTNIPGGTGNAAKTHPAETAGSAKRYDRIIREKSLKYNIEPSVIKAMISVESGWNPRAVSEKGALGLMQLMPSTARDMLINDPFDPEENIEGGVRYLRHLLNRFNGDLSLALAAYNAGPSRVEKSGGIPPIPETENYVIKVISRYKSERNISRIYKVTFDDGTVLYTNTPVYYKRYRLSNF
ncbi:MAG: lytic transglycosylase domain-containing protein [Deferribacteres bacterium]|nr:lytic transglycosylase domain-containing protein [Deferribacteres bacterium]